MSQATLAYHAREHGATEGIEGSYVSQLERGVKRPSARNMAALIRALGHSPADVPVYRITVAREMFDETELPGGLEQAWQNVSALGEALDRLLAQVANAGPPPSSSESRASPSSAPSRRPRGGQRP